MTVTIETRLYTTTGAEFVSPMGYEDTLKKIEEGNGKITLERFAVVNRIVTDALGNQTSIASNAKITTILDTTLAPIACYEECNMTDIVKADVEVPKE